LALSAFPAQPSPSLLSSPGLPPTLLFVPSEQPEAKRKLKPNERLEGRNPTVAGSIKVALSRYGALSLFGFLETTVGIIMRAIQERLGFLGGLIRIIGGLLWAIATYSTK
jgi:hypothetical protein